MVIVVPTKVKEGILAVRDSGKTNMFDIEMVMAIALLMHYYETVTWIAEHKREYAKGIFEGFEA